MIPSACHPQGRNTPTYAIIRGCLTIFYAVFTKSLRPFPGFDVYIIRQNEANKPPGNPEPLTLSERLQVQGPGAFFASFQGNKYLRRVLNQAAHAEREARWGHRIRSCSVLRSTECCDAKKFSARGTATQLTFRGISPPSLGQYALPSLLGPGRSRRCYPITTAF